MKVKLVLFASLREALGQSELEVELPEILSVSEFLVFLGNSMGGHWLEILSQDDVLTAVNQTMIELDHVLQDGDEVAFFPPVTGG